MSASTPVELLGIPMRASDRIEIYSGVARMAGQIWAALHRASRPSKTVVVVVHPNSNFLGHYLLAPLAARGVDAVGLTTRYIGNDSSLIIENCVLDIGAAVGYLRERGYERVVLLGNSGGGGLIALYQSQAESPSITSTPAGDPPDLTQASLPPADALLAVMAHPGRATVFTEFLDPAVLDERDPGRRDPSLDLFGGSVSPPYHPAFIQRYREAQLARNRRITAWARSTLRSAGDLSFVVHGTIADPRFLDLSIDPSDRVPGTMWGPPAQANMMPAGLGRYSSLRSWLSQWSVDDSHCDGPLHLARTSVPVLVVYGTADQVCFPSHARALYAAIRHDRKRLVSIAGGTHYLQGQRENVAILADEIIGWLVEQGVHGS